MLTRRDLLKQALHVGAAITLPGCTMSQPDAWSAGIEVNDMQSQLNATRVHRIVQPTSIDDIQAALRDARRQSRAISVAGGRHAMGGQQFGRDTILLDTTSFNRVLGFDRERGLIEVQGGTDWPVLIEFLNREQAGQRQQWAIRTKQSGVDRVSLGGSLAANIHGRAMRSPPIINDVESFVLLDAQGQAHECSRSENPELFALAIGGYGLFGIIVQVKLRLAARTKLQAQVDAVAVKDLMPLLQQRQEQGFEYADCQYSADMGTDADSHPAVLSCHRPVGADVPVTADQRQLSDSDWAQLYHLARSDKKQAFEAYARYRMSASGQVGWSDTLQLAGNFESIRKAMNTTRGTEMLTEVYVGREAFLPFMARARQDFLEHNVDMTYGTIRMIERDGESFLPWAREPSVCIICNLHVVHTQEGKERAARDFRRIIDRVIEHGGRYYLTYHRWAERRQVEACYPRFTEFLKLKKKYDPQERFQSEWYRHYTALFADKL